MDDSHRVRGMPVTSGSNEALGALFLLSFGIFVFVVAFVSTNVANQGVKHTNKANQMATSIAAVAMLLVSLGLIAKLNKHVMTNKVIMIVSVLVTVGLAMYAGSFTSGSYTVGFWINVISLVFGAGAIGYLLKSY